MDADSPTIDDDSLAASGAYSRRRMLALVGGGAVTAITAGALVGGRWPTAAAARPPTASGAATTDATTAVGTSFDTTAWASGGTELITVSYPPTSIFATANTCHVALTAATTEGPCYFQSDTTDDIALGKTGLPMQLCAQLVDESCAPLAGHTVEAWSCDTRGIYSGDTSASSDAERFAGAFCTDDDAEALASSYLRGQATTDDEGRVNFKTIFPGWYRGRTIHIHFAVSDPDGTTRVISQWCFPDELTEQICTTHDLYADRGVQDTPLAGGTDSVFPADYAPYLLNTAANADGTLLAYGVIQIDPESVAAQAATGGSGGSGGPGGGPGR